MKFKLMIDHFSYKSKPGGTDCGRIKYQAKEHEATIAEYVSVIENGQSVILGVMNGTKAADWQEQQLFMVDIDNDKTELELLTPVRAIAICRENGICPTFYYPTFSDTEEKPKFRLGFIMDEVVREEKQRKQICLALLSLFEQADMSCHNADRIFYGTDKKVVVVDEESKISMEDINAFYKQTAPAAPINQQKQNKKRRGKLALLIESFDFFGYLKERNGNYHAVGEDLMFDTCEICGHNDDLVYYPKTNSFYCFGASGSVGGTIVEYIMHSEKVSRKAAIKKLYELSGGPNPCDGLPPYFDYNPQSETITVSCPLLAKHIRENLRYYFVRDGNKDGVRRFVYDNSGVYVLHDEDMFKGVIKKHITDYNLKALRMSDVTEVYKQLVTDLDFVESTTLNGNEGIINFRNGILDLETKSLLPHSPDYLTTVQIPCDWVEAPTFTPIFDKFMNDLSEGCKETENFLLQFMGVCLSNVKGWRLKKALFLVGKGNTGKSQLKTITERLLGKNNYMAIDLKNLEGRFGTSNIYLKRLAGSSDMGFATLAELKIFKQATGGDSLFAEYKGQNGFEFVYDGLLWFCMNRFPKFGGDNGDWVYDRIIPVECNNVIPPGKQDRQLQEKLYAEREGIAHKAIIALHKVIVNGYAFDEPSKAIEARRKFRGENNTVASFFEECMEKHLNGKIHDNCTTGKIYNVYKAWCADNNNGYAKTAKEFRDELSDYLGVSYHDLTVRRGKVGTFFKDYTLTAETKEHYSKAYGHEFNLVLESAKEKEIPKRNNPLMPTMPIPFKVTGK